MMHPCMVKYQKRIFFGSIIVAITFTLMILHGVGLLGGLWGPLTEAQGELHLHDYVWSMVKIFFIDVAAIYFAYNFRPGAPVAEIKNKDS